MNWRLYWMTALVWAMFACTCIRILEPSPAAAPTPEDSVKTDSCSPPVCYPELRAPHGF